MRFKDFHRNVKIRIYVLAVLGIAQSAVYPFMAVYFARHFGEIVTGILFAASILASVVGGAVSGYAADRIGRKKLMVGAEIVFLLSYLLTAAANSPWWESPVATAATFFLINVSWGIYGPADEAMLLDVTSKVPVRVVLFHVTCFVGVAWPVS